MPIILASLWLIHSYRSIRCWEYTLLFVHFMYPASQLKLIGRFFFVSRQHVNITTRYVLVARHYLSFLFQVQFRGLDLGTWQNGDILSRGLAANSHDSWTKLSIFRFFIMARSCVLPVHLWAVKIWNWFLHWCTIFNTPDLVHPCILWRLQEQVKFHLCSPWF